MKEIKNILIFCNESAVRDCYSERRNDESTQPRKWLLELFKNLSWNMKMKIVYLNL